jgi:uncharacterized protein (TIGR02246 family)
MTTDEVPPTRDADPHSAGEAAAARSVVDRVTAAWDENDPEAFAAVFTEAGTMILSGNRYFRGHGEIRAQMAAAFAGPLKGTRLAGRIVDFRFLGPGAAVVTTDGGLLAPGETDVAWERALRATWVATRQDGEWLVAAYQNGRNADGAPPAG